MKEGSHIKTRPDIPYKGEADNNGSGQAGGADFRAGAVPPEQESASAERIEVSLDSVFGADDTVNPPTLPDEALYGVCGDIVRKTDPYTEAHPAAIYFQLLGVLSNVFGRNAHMLVDRDKHFANEFIIIVGPTALGRKGTAFGHACAFADPADPEWINSCILKSMTSGEGLVREMSDENGRDRRCLLYFTEFASLLNAAKWTGSTITGVVREAWDTGTLHNAAIKNRSKDNKFLKATNCYIAIIGHITREELIRLIPEDADANGFANRFLHVYAKRTKILPDGEELYKVDFSKEQEVIARAVRHARQRGRMVRSPEAGERWREIYPRLTEEVPGRIGKLLSRAAPHVIRLSLILALMDCSTQVEANHIDAAYRLWQYCEQSTLWAYSQWRYSRVAQHILGALKHEGPQTMRQINNDVLKRSYTSEEIRAALKEIEPRIRTEKLPCKTRPVTRVSLR